MGTAKTRSDDEIIDLIVLGTYWLQEAATKAPRGCTAHGVLYAMRGCGMISSAQYEELSSSPPKTLLAKMTSRAHVHPLRNPKHVPGIEERRMAMAVEGKLLVVLLSTTSYIDSAALAARGYRLLVTNAGVAHAKQLVEAHSGLPRDTFLTQYFNYQELMRREYAALHKGRLR